MNINSSVSSIEAGRTQNNLLDHLQPNDFKLIAPHLKGLHAASNEVLYDHGQNIGTVYFPCGPTLVSFQITMEDGSAIETMIIGREGAVGGIVSNGKLPAFSRIMVQFGGNFYSLPINVLDSAKSASKSLDSLFARYADCTMAQIFQSTACNALHGIEQRTAKWILAAVDRTGESEVPLTQERLSAMLGVGRSYISRVIGQLKQEKILSVKRGRLVILNHNLLARKSCRCNDAVRAHFDTVLKGIYPDDNENAVDN
jgi:biotin operon repressor